MWKTWDLSEGAWLLTGWRQHDWERVASFARLEDGTPDIGPLPVTLPTSVRGPLVREGLAENPFIGQQSRLSEWIEHRHWTFTITLPEGLADARGRLVLGADCLDGRGRILIDGAVLGEFSNGAIPPHLDVDAAIRRGGRQLAIVFEDSPSDLGQIGRTSLIRDFKARFNYGWDWVPRIVQIGIPGRVWIEEVPPGEANEVRIDRAIILPERTADGAARLQIRAWTTPAAQVQVSVRGPGVDVRATVAGNGEWHAVDVGRAPTWRLHCDDQGLVDVVVEAPGGHQVFRRVGFRHVEWRLTAGAPAGADPWLLTINSEPVFLAGVNWVPIRPDTADVTSEQLRERLVAYRDLGVNLLRVWGGAMLEQPAFYDLADELGLLVWQELPLSSSGIDNTPPADPDFVAAFAEVASAYAEQLGHHPCLVLWGGGNELTRVVDGREVPADDSLPALCAAREVLADLDPSRRFVPTSPTGPRVWADPAERGQGVHHDVHGPWEWPGSEAEWEDYWAGDDALMRSEVGIAGASDSDLLRAYGLVGPTDTAGERADLRRLWAHSSAWWLERFAAWDGADGLDGFVRESQERQARMLAVAARHTRARFPAVGGFIVWLGHDAFPCPVSLSLLDFDARVKPAGYALSEAWRG
jgi:beta-mannosidase